MGSAATFPADGLEAPAAFFDGLHRAGSEGLRPVTYYGRRAGEGQVRLTAVLAGPAGLVARRTEVALAHSHRALTADHPEFHVFERELHEQTGLRLHDHPWLKPVRTGTTDFYTLGGKEVHEVGVGPVHAGVIEPGHFRFMCLGETVHHLEIALGYQHRGVEPLLQKAAPTAATPLIETIAGDSSVAHAWAHCAALEALAGVEVLDAQWRSRAIGLELERIAMHLATLAGLATDIAFLQGATTYGRLRTTAINTSMLCCGSRFGRGWVRPGGARAAFSAERKAQVKANLALLRGDAALIDEHFAGARSVRARLRDVGVVAAADARALGLVGVAARACGIPVDARAQLGAAPWVGLGVQPVVEPTGDCWARARVRMREVTASLTLLDALLEPLATLAPALAPVGPLAPNRLAVSVCEGVRGEVVHCVETDAAGAPCHWKVQDPSLRNWFGLAMAVRGNEVSDFPICNKSFDLSYCGSDL